MTACFITFAALKFKLLTGWGAYLKLGKEFFNWKTSRKVTHLKLLLNAKLNFIHLPVRGLHCLGGTKFINKNGFT